ncbi:MAG TPA: DUF3592 domain-containing protein [Tepidisphaeraceae bacterium]|jgi:hypothetical protein|nr:DUF3592 domain-containing protein [Tepidisphaeraceae bacterium]
MEGTEQQFQMPRELQRPVPRPIRRRSGALAARCGLVFGRLFILPHILVGIAMAFMVPMTSVKMFFGDAGEGRIVKKWTTSGEETNYHIKYEYDADGVHHTAECTCSRSAYDAMGDPARTQPSIEIRSVNLLGQHFHESLLPGEWRLGKIGFYLLFALFWNGVLSVFVYVLWIAPWRTRQLYRRGRPVPGRIYSKRISSGEDTTYYLDFEFIQPRFGMIRLHQSVSSQRFNSANEGQLVTVLCYPQKKSPAVIYEYGDFECV